MLLRTLRRLPAVGRFAAVRLAVRTGTPRLRELRPDGLGRAARPIAGGLAVLLAAQAAQAQYFGGYNGGCSSCQTTPVVQAASCAPPPTCAVAAPVCQTAMVVQPCMQRVAVTEMQPEERTVMRPVCETRYVDQTVTEYRPVVETKTIDQPVTTYQPVTEYQTVTRDQGSWQTHYVCNQRCSPCQYDGRPGFMGWMNRTGYEMRSAFTPKYTACRTYQPNVVSQQVPVTRQVAVQGTRQVTYNVTRYEPQQTTRKVAVNETRMVAEKITVNRPVTVYRDVPVGTSIAYAPMGGSTVAFGGGVVSNVAYGPISYGGTTTALAPSPDPAATAATPIRTRTAEREPLPPRPNACAQPFSSRPPSPPESDPPPAPPPAP